MTPGYGSGKLSSKWGGDKVPKGFKTAQLQQFTPEQQQLFSQQFGHLGPESYLSRLASGDQSQFEEMEAPAFRQFNEQIGNLSSRFSGMGLGARRSSGFQNTSTTAASNFAQDLASRRQQLQQQAINDLMGLSSTLLGQRPYERAIVQKPMSGLKQAGIGLAGGLGQGLGTAGGMALGKLF